MASTVVFNGVSYSIPVDGDDNWGPDLTAFFTSIASNALQKTGGTYTLTSEIDFGVTFGLKSNYFKSRATNQATTGVVRLGNAESIVWRNAANNADLALQVNASNLLQYNGGTLTSSGSIVNADINAGAAIALSKLAALGTAKVVQTNSSTGLLEASGVTNTTLGFLDATSSVQTQINAQVAKSIFTTKGDLLQATAASTVSRLAVGTDGQVLTADSVSGGGIKWATASASPTSSPEISNLGIAASVAANAMTIAIKQSDGTTDPGAGAGAVKVGVRSSTLTSGLYNQRTLSAASSLVVPSSATLGTANGVAATLYIYELDNAGTLEPAISQLLFTEDQLISSTAISAAATSATVMYSTTARTSVPFRLVGKIISTQATAGLWASAPSAVAVGNAGTLNAPKMVCSKYTSASGQVIATATTTIVDFATKVDDQNNLVTTGASWKFTAPYAGRFEIISMITYSDMTAAVVPELALYKNGAFDTSLGKMATAAAGPTFFSLFGSTYVVLAAGDFIDIRVFHNKGSNATLVATAAYNHVSVKGF